MTLHELYNLGIGTGIGVLVIVILSMIKIPKLEINIWSWLARKFGNAINHDLYEKFKELDKKIDCCEARLKDTEEKLAILDEKIDRTNAVNIRTRILRFGDELRPGMPKHTREHFNQIMEDITEYEKYCAEHPDFPNKKTENTVALINEVYHKALTDNDFR